MKLRQVVTKERLAEFGTSSFAAPLWDLTFEAGLVTLVREGVEPVIVPVGNVNYMRPLDAAKGAKK